MIDTDRDELAPTEWIPSSQCPGSTSAELPTIPRPGRCPSIEECERAERDTMPPSASGDGGPGGATELTDSTQRTAQQQLPVRLAITEERADRMERKLDDLAGEIRALAGAVTTIADELAAHRQRDVLSRWSVLAAVLLGVVGSILGATALWRVGQVEATVSALQDAPRWVVVREAQAAER